MRKFTKLLVVMSVLVLMTMPVFSGDWWRHQFVIGSYGDPPTIDRTGADSIYLQAFEADFNLFMGMQQGHSRLNPYIAYQQMAAIYGDSLCHFFTPRWFPSDSDTVSCYSGKLIRDEPSLNDSISIYTSVSGFQGDLPFVNLFPFYKYTNWGDYSQYLNTYCSPTLGLRLLCTDNYRQDVCFQVRRHAGAYYSNLQELRNRANGRPLWSCIDVADSVHFWSAERQRAYMRLGAFAPLAYGFQGLIYFMYDRIEPHRIICYHNYPNSNNISGYLYYTLADNAGVSDLFYGRFSTQGSGSDALNCLTHYNIAVHTDENGGTWYFKNALDNGGGNNKEWNLTKSNSYGVSSLSRSFVTDWNGDGNDDFGCITASNKLYVKTNLNTVAWDTTYNITGLNIDRINRISSHNICGWNDNGNKYLYFAYGDTINCVKISSTGTISQNSSTVPFLRRLFSPCSGVLYAAAYSNWGNSITLYRYNGGSDWSSRPLSTPGHTIRNCWLELTENSNDSLFMGFQTQDGNVYRGLIRVGNSVISDIDWQCVESGLSMYNVIGVPCKNSNQFDLYCTLDTVQFSDCLLTANQNRTIRYWWAKANNNYIKEYAAPIITGWQWKECRHATIPVMTQLDANENAIAYAGADSKHIKELSSYLMAGVFEKEDSIGLIIVNKSDSTLNNAHVIVRSNFHGAVTMLPRSDSNPATFNAQYLPQSTGTRLEWQNMEGGSCVIFKMKRRAVYFRHHIESDFDGDGKSGVYFRNSSGTLYIDSTANGLGQWDLTFLNAYGNETATQRIFGDYDGDGKTDIALLRKGTFQFLVDYSGNGYGGWNLLHPTQPAWDELDGWDGSPRFTPFTGDYDADGRYDLCYRVDSIRKLRLGYAANYYSISVVLSEFGHASNTHAVSGDYNGDGYDDLAILRNDNVLLIDYKNDGTWGWNSVISLTLPMSLNLSSCVAFASDFDGDGCADLCIGQQTSNAYLFYIDLAYNGFSSPDLQLSESLLGINGNIEPRIIDYDGDGMADIALYVLSSNGLYVQVYPGRNGCQNYRLSCNSPWMSRHTSYSNIIIRRYIYEIKCVPLRHGKDK